MTRSSKVMTWMEEHANYAGDDCLQFPFCRNLGGYGGVQLNGRKVGAHRVMTTLAHGEPPTPKHEAAHSCGNGHLGCVNPKHLRWATRMENAADIVRHKSLAGERHPGARLTAQTVVAIREFANTVSRQAIADLFGIERPHVNKIVARTIWRHI